jgi:hypothetical protein
VQNHFADGNLSIISPAYSLVKMPAAGCVAGLVYKEA